MNIKQICKALDDLEKSKRERHYTPLMESPIDLCKVAAVIRAADIAAHGYIAGMLDGDPNKGQMNRLADTLAALTDENEKENE